MTDEELIRQLLARYWRTLDDRREQEWLALFDANARLEFGETVADTSSALAAIAGDLRLYQGGKHISSNEVITVSGDNASAVSDVVFFESSETSGVTIRFYGRCDDTLHRREGTWRLTSRRITFQGGQH